MVSENELMKKIRAADFVENNGVVMRALNAGYIEYTPLKLAQAVCQEMTEMDFLKSVNYLQLKGYILVRHIKTRVSTELPDAHYTALEARLSDKGVDLTRGTIEDDAVPV